MATRPRLVGLPLEPVLAIRPATACCSAGLSDRCGTRTTAQPAGSSPPHASRSRRWPAPLFPVLLTRDRSASARGVVGGVSASVGVQCSCYLPLLPLGAVEAIHTFKQTDGWGTRPDQTRPDQHTYTHTYEDERGQLLPPLCVYAALPPSSHRPHVFRCDAAARCGAVRIVRQRRQTPTTLEASYSPPEKKKEKKKGNLLPCGGGGRGGARSSLFRDAPDVQRGEPKVKSPRTDGRPADAFFF
jgi:hypothetical protein